jgi:hypothetical protein
MGIGPAPRTQRRRVATGNQPRLIPDHQTRTRPCSDSSVARRTTASATWSTSNSRDGAPRCLRSFGSEAPSRRVPAPMRSNRAPAHGVSMRGKARTRHLRGAGRAAGCARKAGETAGGAGGFARRGSTLCDVGGRKRPAYQPPWAITSRASEITSGFTICRKSFRRTWTTSRCVPALKAICSSDSRLLSR